MSVPTVQLRGSALNGIAPHLYTVVQREALPETVRLGRIRPKARPQALGLEAYFLTEVAEAPVRIPESIDWYSKATGSISRMYLNDRYGDCVVAGKYHAEGIWSANELGEAVTGTDQEVYQQYQQICGPGDNGCVITQVLDVMRTKGLPFNGSMRKIDGYVSCNWRNKDLVRAALCALGCLSIGINLPDAWTSAAVWDVTNTEIVGGHDVTCVGFDTRGVQISSWGRVYTITWAAFTSTRWLDECYALLGQDWYARANTSPFGIDVAALKADLDKIDAGTIPPLDPVPPTPPPAPPTPPPPSPTPAKLFSLTFRNTVQAGRTVGAFRAPVTIPAGKYDVVPATANAAEDAPEPSPPEESPDLSV